MPLHGGTVGSARAALEASLRLAESPKDEERFIGASLALQHVPLLANDAELRNQFLKALGADFLSRMLLSAAAYRRVGLASVRALAVDIHGAKELRRCVAALAQVWLGALGDTSTGNAGTTAAEIHEEEAASAEVAQDEETVEAVQALRQFTRLLEPADAVATLASPVRKPFQVMAQAVHSGHISGKVLAATLSLAQELISVGASEAPPDGLVMDTFLEACCLVAALRGTEERALALGLVAERAEAAAGKAVQAGGSAGSRAIGEVLGQALAETKVGEGSPWQGCASTLRLAAAGMRCQGLALLGGAMQQALQRLQALLRLAGAEVRLGLEGHVPPEALCAGCMFVEAAAARLIAEADELENAGVLQATAECLRALHRIMTDVFDFCIDCAESDDDVAVPVQLPMVGRLIAVWQLEDPLRFATEFRRSLPALCRMPPEDFEVLLLGVCELQDWHLTPGFAKAFEVLTWALLEDQGREASSGTRNALRSCILNLTELALDAAAYLPDAPLPDAPPCRRAENSGKSGADASAVFSAGMLDMPNSSIPRPVVASDPKHPGVQRLQAWSSWLWARGRASPELLTSDLRALAVLCGALLTSVPEEALHRSPMPLDMWAAVAECMLDGCRGGEEAATWRLSLRLCGFVLDRHRDFALTLVTVAASRRADSGKWLPPARLSQISAGADDDEAADEWRTVDESAAFRVREFLKSAVPKATIPPALKSDDAVNRTESADGQRPISQHEGHSDWLGHTLRQEEGLNCMD